MRRGVRVDQMLQLFKWNSSEDQLRRFSALVKLIGLLVLEDEVPRATRFEFREHGYIEHHLRQLMRILGWRFDTVLPRAELTFGGIAMSLSGTPPFGCVPCDDAAGSTVRSRGWVCHAMIRYLLDSPPETNARCKCRPAHMHAVEYMFSDFIDNHSLHARTASSRDAKPFKLTKG